MKNGITFLEGNQKIRILRKQLKLTQGDFQDSHFTRGYLGLLENGRRNITYNASKYIAAKIMEKAKSQGINLSIEDDYFSRPVEKEAAMFCEYKLNEKLSITELEEIEDIAEKYRLNIYRARALKCKGDIYFNSSEYEKAYKNYFLGMQYIRSNENNEEESYILDRAGICKYYMQEYEESMLYLIEAKKIADRSEKIDEQLKCIYDIAHCFAKLRRFDRVIRYCEEYSTKDVIKDNKINYIKIRQLEACAHEQLMDNEGAIIIYRDLIKYISGEDSDQEVIRIKGQIYNSLGNLEGQKNSLAKALENYNKAQLIMSVYDKKSLPGTIYNKARLYIEKKLYDEALMIVNLGIEKSQDINDKANMVEGYLLFEDIYNYMGLEEEIVELMLKLISLYSEEKEFNKAVKCYLKLQELYYRKKDFDGIFSCTEKMKDLLK